MKNVDYNEGLVKEIQKALRDDEFNIYLQPQVNTDNGRIAAFEALVRWNHPVRGMLEPAQFFFVFHMADLMEQLDYLVFEKVCMFLRKRIREGKSLFCISCNFAREHFMKPDFVENIQEIRERYKIPARYLAVEIMEGETFLNETMVQQNVERLNHLGYPVYLDDCGADNSTISDLMFHSITHIKIDKKIVDQIEQENVQILLHGLCSIAHQLSCRTICEGVETQRQMELAKSCGVDAIQGFYFYQPMNMANAENLYDAFA